MTQSFLQIMAKSGPTGLLFAFATWAAWDHNGLVALFLFCIGYWLVLCCTINPGQRP